MSTPTSGPQGSIDLGKRLKEIEQVETNIREILQLAQSCVSELSKEKQTSKNKMDESSNQFKQKLNNINSVLSSQMAYLQNVCVGSAHQGSTFASQQNIELAQNAEFTLHTDLAKLCEQHFPPTLPAHQDKMDM